MFCVPSCAEEVWSKQVSSTSLCITPWVCTRRDCRLNPASERPTSAVNGNVLWALEVLCHQGETLRRWGVIIVSRDWRRKEGKVNVNTQDVPLLLFSFFFFGDQWRSMDFCRPADLGWFLKKLTRHVSLCLIGF